MGDARRRRLALIKGGKADVAKAMYVAPERLTNLTILLPTLKANVAHEIYKTKVDKATCPTPNDFFMAVFDAGMIEFEKFYMEENAPKPAPKADIEVSKMDDADFGIHMGAVPAEEGGEA